MSLLALSNERLKHKPIDDNKIEGYWNEDDGAFTISCPHQLRDSLLTLLATIDKKEIVIPQSKTADTWTADKPVSREQLLSSSRQHIADVNQAIEYMVGVLLRIASKHDFTKIKNIDEFYNNFKFIQDGNVADFKKLNWFQLHINTERHHINERCPEDVDLFDVLEQIADIAMAGMARKGEVYEAEISPEILVKAYKNTLKKILAVTKVDDNPTQE